jgi:hypothetical protein
MSELTGRPGNICIPDAAPINQNGTERANTNKENFRDAPFRDAMAFGGYLLTVDIFQQVLDRLSSPGFGKRGSLINLLGDRTLGGISRNNVC